MKRWLLRQLWTYIKQQLKDVEILLKRGWDLKAAMEHVLYHGRPVD